MPAWPDATLRAFLERAIRRRTTRSAIDGAIVGLAIAMLLATARWAAGWPLLPTVVGAGVITAAAALASAGAAARAKRRIPLLVEAAAPSHNVIVTAAEMLDRPNRVPEAIGLRVVEDATRAASAIDLTRVFPIGARGLTLAVLASIWVALTAALPARGAGGGALFGGAAASAEVVAPSIDGIDVTVVAPPYTGRGEVTSRNPSRVDAIAGSRIRIAVRAAATSVDLETLEGRQALTRRDDGVFAIDLTAAESGFIALEPLGSAGTTGARRLIGLGVTPDRAPTVRLTAPGKDLFLPAADRPLDVGVEAGDDFGVADLRLTYTKVEGAGENFDFTTGEVALTIARDSARAWKGAGALPLQTLGLGPGDLVVYRGVARDQRPGAPAVESDALIVEIVSPGALAADGFAVDDQRDRYALSQRMLIVKTERLAARKPLMSTDDFYQEALTLAAEQRQIRAEFVFMMGGELEDAHAHDEAPDSADPTMLNEEAEAQGEADIAAGRLANQGRIDLMRAIRYMSSAATSLTAPNLTEALVDEKRAMDHIQKAFRSSRYILRTLTQRETLDLSRRLSGTLADIARGAVPDAAPEVNPRLAALRSVLARVVAIAAGTPSGVDRPLLTTLAQELLALDATSADLQKVAEALTNAGAALERGDARGGGDLLADATSRLTATVRQTLPASPAQHADPGRDRLSGALADALRRGTGR
jgi:hypothetical protein